MASMLVVLGAVRILWRALCAPRSRAWDELSLEEQARMLEAEKQRVRALWRNA